MSLASFVLYWKVFGVAFFVNTPPEQASVYDLLKNAISRQKHSKTNRALAGLSITAQKLKVISKHPSLSVTTLDVAFTAVALHEAGQWPKVMDLLAQSISGLCSKSQSYPIKTLCFPPSLATCRSITSGCSTCFSSSKHRRRRAGRPNSSVRPTVWSTSYSSPCC